MRRWQRLPIHITRKRGRTTQGITRNSSVGFLTMMPAWTTWTGYAGRRAFRAPIVWAGKDGAWAMDDGGAKPVDVEYPPAKLSSEAVGIASSRTAPRGASGRVAGETMAARYPPGRRRSRPHAGLSRRVYVPFQPAEFAGKGNAVLPAPATGTGERPPPFPCPGGQP